MKNSRFKKIANVTLPLLKMDENVAYYLKFTSLMFLGKKIEEKKEPAMLANVINLETGEEEQIICSTVLRGILNESFPSGEYVGKCFEIVKHKVKAADTGELKYNTFTVAEVAEPEDDAAETSAGIKGAVADAEAGDEQPAGKQRRRA